MFKVCSLSVLEDFLGQDDLAMIKMIVVWKFLLTEHSKGSKVSVGE